MSNGFVKVPWVNVYMQCSIIGFTMVTMLLLTHSVGVLTFSITSRLSMRSQGQIQTALRGGTLGVKAGRQNRKSWEDSTNLVPMGILCVQRTFSVHSMLLLGGRGMPSGKLEVMRMKLKVILIEIIYNTSTPATYTMMYIT